MESNETNASIFSISHVKAAIQNSNVANAMGEYEKELQNITNPSQRVDLLINHAFAALSLEMTNLAIADMDKAISLQQSLLKVYFTKGVAHLWNNNEDAALSSWRNGLEYTGDISFYVLLVSFINDSNFRAHIFHLRFSVLSLLELLEDWKSPKKFTESDTQNAFAELRSDSIKVAIDHFTQILQCDPKNYQAYKGRGIAYCLIGEWNNCINDISESYKYVGSTAAANTIRSIAYLATNQLAKALTDLQLYLLNYPDDHEVTLEVAKLQMLRGVPHNALTYFMKVPLSSFDSNSLLSFAGCLYSNGEINNSMKILEMVTEPFSSDPEYYLIQFLINRDLNKVDEAIKSVTQLTTISSNPKYKQIAFNYYYELGYLNKSLEIYEEVPQNNQRYLRAKYLLETQTVNNDQTIKEMIKYSEKIGEKCLPNVIGYLKNRRLIRVIGFCTFYIINQIKQKNLNWNEIRKNILILLDSIGDILDVDNNVPIYYIIKNSSTSPQYTKMKEIAFKSLKSLFPDEICETFEEMYQISQSNISLRPKLEIDETEIELPSLHLRYSGVYGFDLYVKSPKVKNVYEIQLQKSFEELNVDENDYQHIIKLVFFIWMSQTFGIYSNEIGQMFLHAFVLCKDKSELNQIENVLFMKQLLHPDINDLSNILNEFINGNKNKVDLNEEILKYWSKLPELNEILSFSAFDNDDDQKQ